MLKSMQGLTTPFKPQSVSHSQLCNARSHYGDPVYSLTYCDELVCWDLLLTFCDGVEEQILQTRKNACISSPRGSNTHNAHNAHHYTTQHNTHTHTPLHNTTQHNTSPTSRSSPPGASPGTVTQRNAQRTTHTIQNAQHGNTQNT